MATSPWLHLTLLLFSIFAMHPHGAKANGGCTTNSSSYQHEVRMATSTSIVNHQYIVTFKGYFSEKSRLSFINSTLRNDLPYWRVIPRRNSISKYPSDFDLLEIVKNKVSIQNKLLNHPYVKKIFPNYKVTRDLKYLPEESIDYKINPGCENTPNNYLNSFIKRKSLSISSSFWDTFRFKSRGLKKTVERQITRTLEADALWHRGYTGQGVRVAIFDTGLADDHPHFKKNSVKDRTNWTTEKSRVDTLGHGTFVAGIIASSKDCLGFAPDAELYIFRVFTKEQASYTSWFLDAFNYALLKKIHVLNLSIGGPDFMDEPFVDKVWELTANGVVMVSAIGNDGPLYGTLNNPADQMDVIGVGGIDYDQKIAKFSSRGMTAWELPAGYGRVKPDIVTYGTSVRASSIKGGCRTLSGTSVASPVVAGAVTLLYSAVAHLGSTVVNPASIKQALIASAHRLPESGMFEQGAGRIDLMGAYRLLLNYQPQVTLSPAYIDFTECPYMWPYCSQPVYYSGIPVIVNVTVINGLGVTGRVVGSPLWQPFTPQFGLYLDVGFTYGDGSLWPWSGYFALHITAKESARKYEGMAQGQVSLTVESPSATGGGTIRRVIRLPIRVSIVPTPPRHRRLLWDQFHNLGYPPGYFPRDNLRMKRDPLDWNGDHPHTNFRTAYMALRARGFYVEVLGSPYTCFDASLYGALLLIDPEEEFFKEEVVKLHEDVTRKGLSLIVLADWFNTSVMQKVKFFDESTHRWWVPDTGGANVPALNDLLAPHGMAFGDRVLEGHYRLAGHDMYYASGTSIVKFPLGGLLFSFSLKDQGQEVLDGRSVPLKRQPILGLFRNRSQPTAGRVALFGDSNCLDGAHAHDSNPPVPNCFWMLSAILEYLLFDSLAPALQEMAAPAPVHTANSPVSLPRRLDSHRLQRFSKVLLDTLSQRSPTCPSIRFANPSPLDDVPADNLFVRQKLLSIDEGNKGEKIPLGPGPQKPGRSAEGSHGEGEWVGTGSHDHDSDPTTFFVAVAVLSLAIVAVFFLNFARKTHAKSKRPPKRTHRLKSVKSYPQP